MAFSSCSKGGDPDPSTLPIEEQSERCSVERSYPVQVDVIDSLGNVESSFYTYDAQNRILSIMGPDWKMQNEFRGQDTVITYQTKVGSPKKSIRIFNEAGAPQMSLVGVHGPRDDSAAEKYTYIYNTLQQVVTMYIDTHPRDSNRLGIDSFNFFWEDGNLVRRFYNNQPSGDYEYYPGTNGTFFLNDLGGISPFLYFTKNRRVGNANLRSKDIFDSGRLIKTYTYKFDDFGRVKTMTINSTLYKIKWQCR
jgi:hypothetical protein